MNFTIERAAFLTAAKRAAQLAPSASPLEVLKCALLEIDTGTRSLHMTATNMEVTGTYTGVRRHMLLCVCSRQQVVALRRTVHAADPRALVMITDVNEAFGEGFQSPEKESL